MEALDQLLDREAQFKAMREERKAGCEDQAENEGVFDYLAQFKVADVHNKGKILTAAQPEHQLLAVPEMEDDPEEDPYMFEKLLQQQQKEQSDRLAELLRPPLGTQDISSEEHKEKVATVADA